MTGAPERLTSALSDHYRIEREIGSGGMATVYLAEDLKHHRKVALKVLRPELAAALGQERFLREIEVTANLHHPHILPLYDSGEADGWLYYVMPYVEGETLRNRLSREKQLPVDDALKIAGEVADALGFAHRHNVIHRDIKPENILLEEGHAVVADFGVALAVSAAGAERLTGTGFSLGTPEYMSPEQATGEQLGALSDIYSLASVVYEMLVGEPPYVGSTAQAVIAKRFSDPAPSARRLRDSIPPPVDSAIKRALAKLPTDRFADAQEFATALAAKHVDLDTEDKSVAVLPFENLSPDPEDEYFSDGMTEEIINVLTQLEGLRVAARTSSFAFKGKRPDLDEVGERLKVSTVLEGSVRKAGNRLRITAQLVNVADGYHLWSERYDRQMEDVFAVQDDIARMVADRLRTTLMEPPAEALVRPPTESLEAYHLYLKGHFFWRKRDKWIPKGLELLEKAAALDPSYALAHAGLADCYASLGTYGFLPPEQARPRAKASAARALELDPKLAEAHCAMGYVQWYCEWKLADAEASFGRAIALKPKLATAHAFLSFLLPLLGRPEEALVAARLACELEPLSAFNRALSAIGHYILRNYEAAIQLCDEAMELDPTLYNAPWIAGWAYEQLGRFEEATRIIEKAVALTGRADPVSLGSLGRVYALSGREDDAEAVLEELKERGARQYVPRVSVARIHAGLGQHDLALDALEQVVENWEPGGWWVFFGPEFDDLRSDRRYSALTEKVRALW